MRLRLWPRNWASPRFAWSCLIVQLIEAQTMNAGLNFAAPASTDEETDMYHIPDDATEDELTELAEEQRSTARAICADDQAWEDMLRPARETPGTIAHTLFSMGSDRD